MEGKGRSKLEILKIVIHWGHPFVAPPSSQNSLGKCTWEHCHQTKHVQQFNIKYNVLGCVWEENSNHSVWKQSWSKTRSAGWRKTMCWSWGGGEDGEGVQRHLHGDQLQGWTEHPGQFGVACQRNVQQWKCWGSNINSHDQVIFNIKFQNSVIKTKIIFSEMTNQNQIVVATLTEEAAMSDK